MYTRYYMPGTGATLHFFGEVHSLSRACAPCRRPFCVTISDLIMDMVTASQAARKRLDVFIEQAYNDTAGKHRGTDPPRMFDPGNKRSHLVRVRTDHGYRVGNYLRVHRIDTRHPPAHAKRGWANLHPLLSTLWSTPLDTKINATNRQLAAIVMESNSYAADLGRLGVGTTDRNATKHEGKSVSRVRKQLLKLPAGLRSALIAAAYDVLPKTGWQSRMKSLSAMLMDVAHLARMLYYAGHGAPAPAKVLVSYDGAAHTSRMGMMLDHLIARGALDAVAEVRGPDSYNFKTDARKAKCLTVRLDDNFGFDRPEF
jgi:hypothetical protein